LPRLGIRGEIAASSTAQSFSGKARRAGERRARVLT
jgi:hypothetical protein